MGGAYTAVQNPDGTWNIQGVPIFASHERKDIGFKVDRSWLEKALAKSTERYAEGGKDSYTAPLHLRHHDDPRHEGAGSFLPKTVGKMKYEGREVDTLFADLINVPSAVYERLKKGEFPYRSVEILDTDVTEISSLALLPDEVPYFRFPNLTIGREIKAEPVRLEKMEPAMAYRADGKVYTVLFNMPMPSPLGEIMKNRVEDPPQTDVAMLANMVMLLKAIAARLGVNVEMLQPAAPGGALTPPAPTAGPAEMKAPGAPVTATAAAADGTKTEDTMNAPANMPAEYVALKGEVAALKAKLDSQDREVDLRAKVKTAMRELAVYNLGAGVEEELFAIAKVQGEGAIKVYSDAIKKHAPKEPPKHFTGDFAGQNDVYPAEVLSYSANGPGAVEKAASHWQSWKSLGNRVSHIKLGDWIKDQMNVENGVPIG